MREITSSLAFVLVWCTLASAQSMPPRILPRAVAPASAKGGAPRLTELFGAAPLASLESVEAVELDRLHALREWNRTGHLPVHNALVRHLPLTKRVELTAELLARSPSDHAGGVAAATTFDRLAWGGMVRVRQAYRLRLHLAAVGLPRGTRLWVHGGGEAAGPFGLELLGPDGGLWTPSVAGEEAAVDVELPAGVLSKDARFGFRIDKVAEIVPLADDATLAALFQQATTCNVDSSCVGNDTFPGIASYRHAIARLQFIDDTGSGALCTGSLLNSTTGQPYLLTANHCISTQSSAASLEAFWDFYTSSCNGPAPAISQVPHSFGATLLATGAADAASDFTLLRLGNLPPGRVFLGWNADPNATRDGTLLFRLSHPDGKPQNFVSTRVSTSVQECTSRRPVFLYSTRVTGGSFPGSSGSPEMLANGEVVGQLFGGCGVEDDCSPDQSTVDGAFAASFPALRPFLSPGAACVPDATSFCLLRRFRVQVSWQNQFDGSSGSGRPISKSDETGFFYFFDPSNYELIVKAIDFGDVIKVFYGELTNLKFTITVTDTASGATKQYKNTPNDCGAIDQSAFLPGASAASTASAMAALEPPALLAVGAQGSCGPSSDTLCLLGRRLAVEVAWHNQFNSTAGTGAPVTLSNQSGYFTFTDPSNVELVVKAVDFSDRLAIFYGALSDLEYTLTVTDTRSGAVKTYHNPPGNYCGGLDNSAFPP
ncbi:MAG: trypsin-like peptidase domain-containing protein [Acidobacteriota bacterium]|nr:trypsin-like peptidase domain-containing protein [Acidobacteriota bacterium]